MSIINDALKKVQQNLEWRKKIISTSTSVPTPSAKEKFSHISQIIILGSFLGSVLIFILLFTLYPKQKTIIPSTTDNKEKSSMEKVVTALIPSLSSDPKPLPEAKSSTAKNRVIGLTLNGIIQMNNGYVALINNKIVKEGDAIGEKKVLKIDEKQVKIFNNGETVILQLGEF